MGRSNFWSQCPEVVCRTGRQTSGHNVQKWYAAPESRLLVTMSRSGVAPEGRLLVRMSGREGQH
ncbi:MAG: hypothetical protein PHP50_12305 [Lachnospiraceae bacterium]|nr:hypothetical protein [Lachnospiraceae bacterium]